MDVQQFEGRKRDHIRHALDSANQAAGLSGLDHVRLVHEAIPDLDLEEVRLESRLLGRAARTPFYVAGMTAGHGDAYSLNRTLALACQARGWAMGAGSLRREMEGRGDFSDWKRIREEAPELVLFANIGISQVLDAPVDRLEKLISEIGAQALAIHLNSLQECMQPEGTPRFKGAWKAIQAICSRISVPVVLKETGCGFSGSTLKRLARLAPESKLAAIDVSGLGGTHWGRIEGARATGETGGVQGKDSLRAEAARTFANWGVPTAESVRSASSVLPKQVEIWASGGVRSGLDAAKLIALGAHQVGYAKPALEAALQGESSLQEWMARQEFELRVALFCTGCASPTDLRDKEEAWTTSGI